MQQNLSRVETIIANLQTHSHTGTCHKGRANKKCRLARPQPFSSGTTVVMLKRMPDGSISVERNITSFQKILAENEPFIDPDRRNLFWLIERGAPMDDIVDRFHNGNIIEFNFILTSATGSNTCVSILGDQSQAKSCTYYMINYMTKDPLTPTIFFRTIYEAVANTYESTALDRGTTSREAKLLLQRIHNKVLNIN